MHIVSEVSYGRSDVAITFRAIITVAPTNLLIAQSQRRLYFHKYHCFGGRCTDELCGGALGHRSAFWHEVSSDSPRPNVPNASSHPGAALCDLAYYGWIFQFSITNKPEPGLSRTSQSPHTASQKFSESAMQQQRRSSGFAMEANSDGLLRSRPGLMKACPHGRPSGRPAQHTGAAVRAHKRLATTMREVDFMLS